MNNENLISIEVNHYEFINYTFISNKLNFIKYIRLENCLEDLENIEITIKSVSKLFEDYTINLDKIIQNEIIQLTEFNFIYNLDFLRSLAERELVYSAMPSSFEKSDKEFD